MEVHLGCASGTCPENRMLPDANRLCRDRLWRGADPSSLGYAEASKPRPHLDSLVRPPRKTRSGVPDRHPHSIWIRVLSAASDAR